jgi:hypothetical protein
MESRILRAAGLGLCLSMLALSAASQTPSGSASQAAVAAGKTAAPAATTTAGAPKSGMAPAGAAKGHHAKVHHTSHAGHENTAMRSAGKAGETAYRAALRHCVAGPAAQREGCLDSTIVRFGRT